MPGGTWSATEAQVRPGFYLNFISVGVAAVKPGARGVVGVPVKGSWGPIRQFVSIESEADLLAAYGPDTSGDVTAYKIIRLALLGGAKTVLAYRIADSNAAKASVTLADTNAEPTDVLQLTAKYEGGRGTTFKVTTRTNPVDSEKQDVLLFEGATVLRTFTFTSGTGGMANAVTAINGDSGNVWITAAKLADGNGVLATVSLSAFSGGNSGTAGLVNADYTAAMTAFEAREFDLFVLDGPGSSGLQTAVSGWVDRIRSEGKGVIAVLGGSVSDDQTPATGNQRSAGFDLESVVNVVTSAVLDGETYPSGDAAAYVGGLIAGQKLTESITYAATPFDDVTPRLTNTEVVEALKSGSLALVHDGRRVKVELGINTLTTLGSGQNDQWKKIRAIRVMDAINADLLKTAADSYIGKVPNDDDGRAALLSAIKNYMDVLASAGVIGRDYTVGLDPAYPNPPADEVYVKWEVAIVDAMEKIFGTFVVR